MLNGTQTRTSICDNDTGIRVVSCDKMPLEMRGARSKPRIPFMCVPSLFVRENTAGFNFKGKMNQWNLRKKS